MKHLYDSLRACAKEEEVKAEFCKFFKMKIFALRGIDHYDWDRAPSTPCPGLVGDVLASFSLKGNNANNFEKQLSGEARANSPAQTSSKAAAPVGAAEEEKVVFTSCPGCFKTKLSLEAQAVMTAARALYRAFYANITRTPWMDWKIETWDVGYYQIRNAMKGFCDSAPLREKHDALRAKLLPQIYSLGFLNPDVEYFK